jgi:predicted dehydrogenase
LAIKKGGLDQIAKILKKKEHPYLSVGFNRRFAPLAIALKEAFEANAEPFYVNYRVNAGFIPATHWLHDPKQGGGRLIGEGCHFIDFVCFIIGKAPLSVRVAALPNAGKYSNDNFVVNLEFEDGSVGTVSYLSNGNKRFAKEYVEVFNGGKIGILNDYRSLELVDDSRTINKKSRLKQDKGHQASWQAFLNAIQSGQREPIPYEQLLLSNYATLAANQALLSGETVNISDFIQSD